MATVSTYTENVYNNWVYKNPLRLDIRNSVYECDRFHFDVLFTFRNNISIYIQLLIKLPGQVVNRQRCREGWKYGQSVIDDVNCIPVVVTTGCIKKK